MNGDTLYSIGDLARRTGLTVKTIRFYADRGIVSPTDRSPAGYRRYDLAAAARLDLVRTLRDLGVDLATIRKVLDRELQLPEIAAAHAEALAAQIRTLHLRRAVLMAVASRGSTPEETDHMHRLATLSEHERARLIEEFLESAFGAPDAHPALAAVRRTLTPRLPDEPEAEQLQAWLELAELSQDPDFRAAVRQLAEPLTAERAVPRPDAVADVRDRVRPALAAGIAPASPEAAAIVEALLADHAMDPVDLRRRLEAANDPRRERYLTLLAVVNGWPAPESLTPALDWAIEALATRSA